MTKKGDIYLFENTSAEGFVQKGMRPHLVVVSVVKNIATLAPLTSSAKRHAMPYSVVIKPDGENKLHASSVALLSQVLTCDVSALGSKIGHLSGEDMLKIQLEFIKMISN
jgi:mRNA-degrading endonuclease toxin of MazEF toxin-antitoxin module